MKPDINDLEEDANDWIKSALASKRPPKDVDEAWEIFRRVMMADTRNTPVASKSYFRFAYHLFSKNRKEAMA